MSADIHSEIPNASPILAYGEARTPRHGGRIFFCALAAIIVISIFSGAWAYGHTTADIPDHIAIIASVKGGTTLPTRSPELWKDAVHGSNIPVVLGLAKTDTRWEPFAIVPDRTASAFPYHESLFGFYSIVSDRKLERHTPLHLSAFMYALLTAWRHDAYLRIYTAEIFPSSSDIISGTIDKGVWETTTPVSSTELTLPASDIAMNTAALPGAERAIREALASEGLLLDEDSTHPLGSFGASWSDSGARLLTFDFGPQGPSTSTFLTLAASAGITDEEIFTLPDETISTDLRLPQHFFAQTSSTQWSISTGTTLEISRSSILIGDITLFREHLDPSCPADAQLAHFSKRALQKLTSSSDFVFLASLNVLDVASRSGRLIFCTK